MGSMPTTAHGRAGREREGPLNRRLRLRDVFAPLLGGITGLALCRGVLPLGLHATGYGSYLALGFYLDRFCWFGVVVMALGGLGVARSRHVLEAVRAFSWGGLVTGAGLAALALDTNVRLLAVSGLLGWMYGLPAGLLLQAVLSGLPGRAPAEAPALERAIPGESQAGATNEPAAPAGDDYVI